jgi:hypothetical protein
MERDEITSHAILHSPRKISTPLPSAPRQGKQELDGLQEMALREGGVGELAKPFTVLKTVKSKRNINCHKSLKRRKR